MIWVTEAHEKEPISRAYVSALAAHAGMTTSVSSQDYGLDGTFKDIEYDPVTHLYDESGFGIDFQLKATVNAKPSGGIIKYNLEIKNYQRLIKKRVGCPRILVVYALPKNKNEWINITVDETIFKKCAWWCSLKGLPNVANKNTILVEIPEEQLLTPTELVNLMKKVKEGGEL